MLVLSQQAADRPPPASRSRDRSPVFFFFSFVKVIGGRFLDRWVLEHVRPLVSIRENPRNPTASEHLVRNRDNETCRHFSVFLIFVADGCGICHEKRSLGLKNDADCAWVPPKPPLDSQWDWVL